MLTEERRDGQVVVAFFSTPPQYALANPTELRVFSTGANAEPMKTFLDQSSVSRDVELATRFVNTGKLPSRLKWKTFCPNPDK